nr:LytTR family DNA-binding domain-containing protein [Allomuricauda sp.]
MQHIINTLVVEDNPKALKFLKKLVDLNPNLNLEGTASNVKEALSKLKTVSPELVLMDIELGDGNAFDVLDRFEDRQFQVIFITGHEEYIKKAFEYYAFYYLSKPFDEQRFNEVIHAYVVKSKGVFDHYRFDFLKAHFTQVQSKFLLHVGSDYVSIDLTEVVYCKSEANFAQFYFLDGTKKLASHSLKYYATLFSEKGFFRVNRFCLLNTKNIQSINKRETIVMKNGHKINVSIRNKAELATLITKFNR